MGTFRTTITINRPPAEVFSILADAEQTPSWYSAVVSARRTTPGPVGRGSRYRLVRSLPGGVVENEVEITDYEPGRRFTLSSVSGPTPFRYAYSLDRNGPATTVILDGEIAAEGLPIPSALRPFATRAFAQGMGRNLAVLKRMLE